MSLYTMDGVLLKIHHADGVFSCYTVRLEALLDYYNTFKRRPALVDSSQQFAKWKEMHHGDISDAFFRHDASVSIPEYDHPIKTTSETDEQQFSNYSKLHFSDLRPFVAKFFAPSAWISARMREIYSQFPSLSEDFCGVLYRGTCKKLETRQPSHFEFVYKVSQFKLKHPDAKFLIQTDEPSIFAALERQLGHNNCFIVPIQGATKLATVTNYVANVMAMAKCKHLITTSGNGEYWLRLFRGNNDNSTQWLSPKEHIYGKKNESFDPNQRKFWLES
jgi:hypothetical protein